MHNPFRPMSLLLFVMICFIDCPKGYCTDQEMEFVVIDGSEFVFLDRHLSSFWEKAPEFDVQFSSNWAGYTARWEIKDGKLWLTAFSAKLKGKVVEPKDLFHAELPIHAKWVNGPSYAAKNLKRENSIRTARDVERVFFVDGIVHKRSHIESANVNWWRLGIGFENTRGKLTIKYVVEGSPAEQCGRLSVGDEVIAMRDLDDEVFDISAFPAVKAAQFFRGLSDQPIRFSIRSGKSGEELAIELSRASFLESLPVKK